MKFLMMCFAALTATSAMSKPVADSVTTSPLTLDMTVRPVRGGSAEVTAVEVKWRVDGVLQQTAKPFSVQTPITYAGRTGIADRVEGLVLQDSSGEVSLKVEDDPTDPAGFPFYRHWRAGRRVVPPVVLTYRMRSFTGTATRGPQFDFYSHSGGISSGGMALFVLPESLALRTARLKWDLADLAPGSTAASTNGDGDFEVKGGVEELMQAYYMAGPLGRYAPADASSGFRAYWLGQPPFDPQQEMDWTYQAYDYLRKFYRDSTTSSYCVFVRALPGAGGGTALRNSFMLGTAVGRKDSLKPGPRNTLAHEMGHMWIGGLKGGEMRGTPWFDEGLNVHYTRLLLLRSGLVPVSEYESDINRSARAYYVNLYKNASADSLGRLGFSTGVGAGSAQNVPYNRGSLYFADVDAKIRAASGGRRTLDDVVLPLFDRRRAVGEISADDLLEALAKEIGPEARKEFEAVIVRGETIVPEPGAFGPCFERRPVKLKADRGELDGFEWVRMPSVPDSRCREW